MELGPSSGANSRSATKRTSHDSVESESSLPCSQEPSTGPYPGPYQPSTYHHIPSLLRFILILSIFLRLCLPTGLFSSGFPTNILYAFLFAAFVLQAPPLAWSFYLYLVKRASIAFLRSVLRLLVTVNVVPNSPILVIMMVEAIRSSETSFLQEQHGVTSQGTAFLIVTAVKISNVI
jgi:hypothetical protein